MRVVAAFWGEARSFDGFLLWIQIEKTPCIVQGIPGPLVGRLGSGPSSAHWSPAGPGFGVWRWRGLSPFSTVRVCSCPGCPVPDVSENHPSGRKLLGERCGRGCTWAGHSPQTLHRSSADQTLPLARPWCPAHPRRCSVHGCPLGDGEPRAAASADGPSEFLFPRIIIKS